MLFHIGYKALHAAAHDRGIRKRLIHPASNGGEHCGAKCRRFDKGRTFNIYREHVGEVLCHPVIGNHAAINPQFRPIGPIRSKCCFQVMGLVSHRLQRGAGDMRLGRGETEPADAGPCIGAPMRRAKAGQCGYKIYAAIVGNAARQCFCVRRMRNKPQIIAQPLDEAACDKYRSFQRVMPLTTQLI